MILELNFFLYHDTGNLEHKLKIHKSWDLEPVFNKVRSWLDEQLPRSVDFSGFKLLYNGSELDPF